ncbi:hypothetical protein K0U27_05250 [archaeon]|nr:hypothetical protein [archaeon]
MDQFKSSQIISILHSAKDMPYKNKCTAFSLKLVRTNSFRHNKTLPKLPLGIPQEFHWPWHDMQYLHQSKYRSFTDCVFNPDKNNFMQNSKVKSRHLFT